jgi:hypothetical protein
MEMKRLVDPKELLKKKKLPRDYVLYNIDNSIKKNVRYNKDGNETYRKECYDKKQCREYKSIYDERGLLIRKEYDINGKLYSSIRYDYE